MFMQRMRNWLCAAMTVLIACLAPLGVAQAQEDQYEKAGAFTLNPPFAEPATGWYWNPDESGRGFAIERQGDTLFLAGFMYEESGAQVWYVSTLRKNSAGSYDGAFVRYEGGQPIGGTYRSPSGAEVAKANIAFAADLRARLIVTAPGKAPVNIWLERFAFAGAGFPASQAGFHNGWYWNPQESGRGFFVEVQGTTAYLATFMYGVDGKPTWYTMAAPVSSGASFSGPLGYYLNGQSLLGGYRKPVDGPQVIGSAFFRLNTDGTGTLDLPGGNNTTLKPFDFNGGRPQPKPVPGVCAANERLVTGVCAPKLPDDGAGSGSGSGSGSGTGAGSGSGSGSGSGTGSNAGPSGVYLRTAPATRGQTFQVEYCNLQCMALHPAYYVSDEDFADEETPPIFAYVNHAIDELNKMIKSLFKAGKLPPDNVVVAVLGGAIRTAIENDTQTVVEDALAGFARAGYPVPGDNPTSSGGAGTTAPPDTSTETRCVSVSRSQVGNFRLTNTCTTKITVSWCVVAPDNRSWVQCSKSADRYGTYSKGQTDLGVGRTHPILDSFNATQVLYVACATNRGLMPALTDLVGNGLCR